ncbi:MAG: hypothetical protein ACK41V_02275 [Acidovorax sp.]|uniref:hypothetical protein n=1 Tax=Acidovorax sp. TaxID=1872122 RepID=UPI00391C69C7
MNDLLCAASALSSLLALTYWARAVPTRAWGDASAPGAASPQRVGGVVLGTLLLQTTAAVVAAGWAAGFSLVLTAWMGLGWLLVLAMNHWPQPTLRWAPRLGWVGGGICALVLGVQGLQLGGTH